MKKSINLLLIGLTIFIIVSCSSDLNDPKIPTNNPPKDENLIEGLISNNDAKDIAIQFAKSFGILPPQTRSENARNLVKIVYTGNKDPKTRSTNIPYYYFVNIDNCGYVIVSSSDATLPVLGYSTSGTFDPDNIPPSMNEILKGFTSDIKYIRANNIRPDSVMIKKRKDFWTISYNSESGRSINPLLGSIKWGQKTFYNSYCPDNTPVGCVATAVAQLLRYWEYPSSGQGSHTYSSKFGSHNFNFDYELKLNEMPKQKLTKENDAVAKFCYGIAVGLNMQFAHTGSATWQEKIPMLLVKHFKYPATMKMKYKENFNDEEWENIVKHELDEGRPVPYVAYAKAGGHSFICDGYDDKGYFHFNWGWGGKSDGYFLINSLTPSPLKDGDGFNKGQAIITNIEPPKNFQIQENKAATTPEDNTDSDSKYPESKGLFAITTFIKNITLSNIDNVTKSNSGGYNYFRYKTIEVKKNKKYKLYLTPGATNGQYTEYWRVWIDINQNGNFEENEKIVDGVTKDLAPLVKELTFSDNIPSGKTRMRVSMKWGGYPEVNETFRHGEVEDYNIIINK